MENVEEMSRATIEMKEILKYVTKEMYEKIPESILNVINNYQNENYKFKYDLSKKLVDQDICNGTKKFLAYLDYNYWANEEEKKEIDKIWDEYDRKNSDIFKHSKNEKEKMESVGIKTKTRALNVSKQNFIEKIINKIKSFFSRKGK